MLKNAYFASLRDYRLDVENCRFSSALKWANHAKALYYTTFDINEDACIAFRCQLPGGSVCDCMLLGFDKAGNPNAAFIMMGVGPFESFKPEAPEDIAVRSFGYSYNHFSGGAKPAEQSEGGLPMYYVDHQSDLASELEDMFNGGRGEEVSKAFGKQAML